MNYDDRQATWQNPRVLGLLLLIFLVGAAAGAVVMKLADRAMVAQAMTEVAHSRETAKSADLARNRDLTLQHFKTELNLTPKQTEQVQLILDDFLKYMQTLQDQMDDTRALGKQRILRVLTDEQKLKFEKVMSDLQKPPSGR